MSKRDSIGKKAKREIVRAMLERTQSMNMGRMMSLFGASEPVVYEDVEETLNVAYVNRDEVALAMDIFKPTVEAGTELPVIIAVHGGGLFMGDRELERPYCRLLAHKGYLVFSLEYRLAPKANLCQQLDDVCAGMDHVGRMLVNYDVDFNRIFLVADSAGAYLAAYVSAMHDSKRLQDAIGYEPSKMIFAAVGFVCGMFYTNRTLQEQIYGDKRFDEKFLEFMNIEHPEIINNIPPAFLITSCGDIFNNYSLRFNRALKKGGRTSKLIYLGDEELQHIFPITNPEDPRSLEATDKMLAWFEEQVVINRENRKKDPETKKKLREVEDRIKDGSISNQKVWANIKERIVADEGLMKRTAIIDCTREYTYAQMFDEWERYARVFSALGICAENGSRAALCGVIAAEPLFALFGLNMTGAEISLFSYPDFLPNGMWKAMIEKEKVTDLIVSDTMVTPEIREEIEKVKEEFGLRNVIYLHSLMGGPTVGPAELIYNEYNYHMLRRMPESVFMNDLLTEYANAPIQYDESKGERIAFIAHTSGTTHGTRKPLPFTDKMFNDTLNMLPRGYHTFLKGMEAEKPIRCIQAFDFSSVYSLSGQIVIMLATADTLVMTFFGFMHPKFLRAIEYYYVNAMSVTGFMFDKWLDDSAYDDINLASLKIVGMSGAFVPPEKMEKYNAFLKDHGCQCEILAGYGMTEAGGKPMFAPQGGGKDILGFADDAAEEVRIKDENDGKFYKVEDGPRTGLLYKYSDTRCSNELDGQLLFEYTEIDGKDFLCTNDLVRVNEDGSLSFAGRTDKYFVNNEGRKFDSGIVDNNMAAHAAVDRCVVVPMMEKRIHDTVPVLYVVPAEKGPNAAESIRQAFVDVYVREKKIGADNLPTQFMLVDDIPLNANGKLDIFRITRERIGGDAYDLIPVIKNGKLTDIQTKHVESVNSLTAGTLPKGMENNSAYNVFDLFTAAAPKKESEEFSLLDPFGLLRKLFPDEGKKKEKKEFQIPESVKKAVLKYGNRLSGIQIGRKWIDFDFEE